MYKRVVAASFACLMITSLAFAQSGSLTGTVTDPSGALLPGVTLTVTNVDTSIVVTGITNEVGVYNFASLQPGTNYKVSASLPGFQTITATNMQIPQSVAVRQNFEMKIATTQTNIEVTVDRRGALTENSASVGDVLPEYRIKNLPLVGNNVLDLLNILPGIRFSNLGEYANTVAGMGLNSLNVTLDGLPTRDERFSAQAGLFQGVDLQTGESSGFFSDFNGGNNLLSTTTINPDLVGEIRLILSPVDAEMGRGNSQLQITTRSGTNKFTGSAVWNIQNTALNPNTWDNNNDIVAVGADNAQCRLAGQTPPCWNPTQPNWRNTNQYTVSFGGPIIRGKTFFFVLWDQQISNSRVLQRTNILTEPARNGIYRFFEGFVPGDANDAATAVSGTSNNPTMPAVDFAGNPLVPTRWPNGAAYDGSQAGVPAGRLLCFSVFGTTKADGSPFVPGLNSPDCPSGVDSTGRGYSGLGITPSGTLWDNKRPDAISAAQGYFSKILARMPHVNDFTGGDGLNTSAHQFLLRVHGNNLDDSIAGSESYTNRKQINIKIDQNFSIHRISAGWTRQADDNTDPQADWPGGLSGQTTRRPQTFTLNATSTISSKLLNEARFGLNLNKTNAIPPWKGGPHVDDAWSLILDGGVSRSGNGLTYPVLVSPATGGIITGLSFEGGVMDTAIANQIGYRNPLYDVADTVSWTHGKHAFKFGGDFRFPRSNGYSLQPYPLVAYGNLGGTTTVSPFQDVGSTPTLGTTGTPSGSNPAYFSNLFPQTGRNTARNLAYILTNSMGSANTPYWAENFEQTSAGINGWQDTTTQENRTREMVYSDFAIFAKDDYKITRDLTLNLGVRYEYYSPPYITSGLTSTVLDQGYGLFGVGRGPGAGTQQFDHWLEPGSLFLTGYGTNGTGAGTNNLGSSAVTLGCSLTPVGAFADRLPAPNCDPNFLSNIEFIGPNSPNLNKTVIPRDRNNFGPAIGFAWQLPWFGAGKTTLRGGYQLTFQRVNIPEGTLASSLGGFLNQTATENDPAVQAITGSGSGQLNRAVLISDTPGLIPVLPSRGPGQTVPVHGRSQTFTAFNPNYATPYTQNLTLSVTRALSRTMTLDFRYIGNLSRKISGSLNLNASTVFYNKELFDAFDAARRGENPELLDQLLAGLDLAPSTGNTTYQPTGATFSTNSFYGPVGTCTPVSGTGAPPTPATAECPAGHIFQHGAEHLRRGTTYGSAALLASGDYAGLAALLAGTTAPTGGLQTLTVPIGEVTPSQRVLRNGCDRIANGRFDSSLAASYPIVVGTANAASTGNIPTRCFPENYLLANPQLNNATYNANLGRNNYHSLQVQFTMRPVQGTNFQGTYTWAKSMQLPSSGYTDPQYRELDHVVGNERAHTFRLNGTFELPFGPNKLFFGNTSGWVARLVERWQTSLLLNLATGGPSNVLGAQAMRYGNARYVTTSQWRTPKGHVEWNGPNGTGTYYGVQGPGILGSFATVTDPQCLDGNTVAQVDSRGYSFSSDSGNCGLDALALRVPATTAGSYLENPASPTSDSVVNVLVNARPGETGTLTANTLRSFGQFSLDANAQKTFQITESKQLTIRIDTTNVLNHPQPFVPNFFTNFGTFFGIIEDGVFGAHKSGTRTFQGQVRLSF